MQIKKIAVLVSGGGSNLQQLIDATVRKEIEAEICVVIADKKDAYALERAKKYGIPNVGIDKKSFANSVEFNKEVLANLKHYGAEAIILAGYLSILPKSIIDEFKDRILNIHPSLIPSFCGAGFYGHHVHQAVLDYGAKVSGATVHFVDEGTDTGAIIVQDTVPVHPDDTADDLAARVLQVEHRILPYAVKAFTEGRIKKEGRKTEIIGG